MSRPDITPQPRRWHPGPWVPMPQNLLFPRRFFPAGNGVWQAMKQAPKYRRRTSALQLNACRRLVCDIRRLSRAVPHGPFPLAKAFSDNRLGYATNRPSPKILVLMVPTLAHAFGGRLSAIALLCNAGPLGWVKRCNAHAVGSWIVIRRAKRSPPPAPLRRPRTPAPTPAHGLP